MKASQLRDLTRKYAAGNLGREEYLAERARLIDGVVAGDIELRYRHLEPAGSTQRGAVGQKHWLLAAGSIMLVGLLLIALLAYFLDGDAKPAPGTHAVAAEAAQNPGAERLQLFMNEGDWSETALAELENDWKDLSAFHQESARRSVFYRRLKHETHRRIGEQEALLAAGKMEALLQATRLRKFAEQLGIQPDP